MAEVGDEEKIAGLRKEIGYHSYRYYGLDDPVISDSQYDELMVQLKELEERYPELLTSDSPTQRVGAAPSKGFAEVQHVFPMLSLANAFSLDELEAWRQRVTNLLEGADFEMVCELKIDGLAVSLTYQDGRLVRGATRGDGYRGEDVTQNLRTVRSIPIVLMGDFPRTLEVRGEVYMSRENFRKLNEERMAAGEPPYANPRNTSAGAIRQLDSRITASRNLDIFVYGLGHYEDSRDGRAQNGSMPDNQWDTLQRLSEIGFKTNPQNVRCGTTGEVEELYARWLEERHHLPYQTDGLVVKVDSFRHQDVLGVVGREPRWAIAYKFPAEQAVTRLLDIGINVGRTGSLNPFAILDPVNVSGAVVKMATLHNEEDIRRKDIRVGDWVVVERAGEVIPQIVGPVVARRTGEEKPFGMPRACPVCATPVVKPESEAMHRCPNAACPAQFFELLKHFVGRGAMDIEGLGGQWCRVLIDAGLVQDVADLYYLERERLLDLDRMGDKLASRIMENLEASKSRPLSRVIFALGILHIGSEMAELLAQQYAGIDRLAEATRDELSSIPGIGPKIASSVVAYFGVDQNRKVIDRLRGARVKLERDSGEAGVAGPGESGELPLVGLSFAHTGTLGSMSRSGAEALIKELGGSTSSSVTKKTSYLVVGTDPGSKLDTARRLGTEILAETEFLELVRARSEENPA